MWLFGYTDEISGDGPIDVIYGECSTFVEAVAVLYDHVEKDAVEAEKYELDHYEQVLGQIRTVRDNPDILYQDDTYQMDTTFTDKLGEVDYFVTHTAA